MAKKTDYSKVSRKDLGKTAKEIRAKKREFRFSMTGSKITNVNLGNTHRRDLARSLSADRAKAINEGAQEKDNG